jgi:3-hydroxyacyl-[acyl-carrier-protein] dehydratase
MADMDVYEILSRLPHRFPMLMIDRVLECEPGKRIVALKNVSINEPFFQGHFPGMPILPGVLILEAMAQAAGLLAFSTMGTRPTTVAVLLRRHRQRALQAPGEAGRPADRSK